MDHYIDIHTHNPLNHRLGVRNFRLAAEEKPTSDPLSAGIHPWDSERLLPCSEQLLRELEGMECVAIGEIGLDKVCDAAREAQQTLFEKQLDIATHRELPVIIHCVKSQAEILEKLKGYPNLPAVIFHGFIGSPQQAKEIISNRHYISFGFSALRSPKTIKAIEACPTENIFLESDESQEDITTLYQGVATIKGVTTEQLCAQIFNNYRRIFQ